MLMDKIMSESELTKELLAQQEAGDQNRKTVKEHMLYESDKKYNEETEMLYEASENARMRGIKLDQYSALLKENLLHQAVCTVFDRVLEGERATHHEYAIGHSMISKFIKEEGVDNLLMRFDCDDITLSEFARCTEKYHRLSVEAVGQTASANKDDDCCYVFDKELAQQFIDDVKDVTPQNTIDLIRDRVSDSMQMFLDQNTENKIAIKDIYTKTKAKIATTDDDTIKEEYTQRAKVLTEAVYNKPTSVFTAMVNAIGESVIRTPELQKHYMENNKINLNRLADDARIMYTVLEMVNTLNMTTVNEDYIKQVITDLKE